MAANMMDDLHFFFIEIENFRGERKIFMRHKHFYKILEES